MAESEIISRRPEIGFATKDVNPPSPLYVTRDDNLVVEVWNALAGATVDLKLRLLLPNGEVVRVERNFVLTSARAINFFTLELAEGFLLDIELHPFLGVPRRGQTYAQVFVAHGDPNLTVPSTMLIADYIEQMKGVSWPRGALRSSLDGHGMLRSITGADPAAGVEISETVPTNARWKLWGFTFTLVTDATVANRIVDIVLDDGANIYYRASVPTPQTATQTVIYSAAPQGVAQGVTNLRGLLPLPIPCPLFQAHRIRTLTQGIVAGDNFGAPQYLVEEWLEE